MTGVGGEERPNLSAAARARELRKAWLRRVTRASPEAPGDDKAGEPSERED